MSDEQDSINDDIIDDEALEQGLKKKKLSGKVIVLALIALLVIGGGGAAAYFLLMGDDATNEASLEDQDPDEPIELLFYDLEPIIVNLNSTNNKSSYLKITISLEVDRQSSLESLEEKLPRVIDNFQIYLRELRLEDLNGSAGMFRLKEELLIRVNEAVHPTPVKDVLFKEIFING